MTSDERVSLAELFVEVCNSSAVSRARPVNRNMTVVLPSVAHWVFGC
jgi:hypothetical protein